MFLYSCKEACRDVSLLLTADLGTTDLSSPIGVGTARYARLSNTRVTNETIINHD